MAMTKSRENAWMLDPELESLWDQSAGEALERRRGLTLDAIVDKAVEIAGAEGIAAVSMARVAKELGFATMALYRHVPSKSALIVLMIDRAVGEPPPEFDDAAGWRDQVGDWARQTRQFYQNHPWIHDIPVTGPPATPNNLRWMERFLVAMRATPLTFAEKTLLLVMLAGYIRGHEALVGTPPSVTEHEVDFGEVIMRLTSRGGFPELSNAVAEGAFTDDGNSPDEEFIFGLERFLDGIEILIEGRLPNA